MNLTSRKKQYSCPVELLIHRARKSGCHSSRLLLFVLFVALLVRFLISHISRRHQSWYFDGKLVSQLEASTLERSWVEEKSWQEAKGVSPWNSKKNCDFQKIYFSEGSGGRQICREWKPGEGNMTLSVRVRGQLIHQVWENSLLKCLFTKWGAKLTDDHEFGEIF